MTHFMHWIATAATLTFSVPLQAGQNDPRLPSLFDQLKEAATAEEAETFEQAIWKIWLLSANGAVDAYMLRGIRAMGARDNEAALAAFDRVVTAQPDFAEGWNKRATVNYLLGRFDASVLDIQKTLELEPRHFGALSGLGLINLALGREREALKAFEAALRIHPNLPGANTHIRELRKKVRGKEI
ncbi:MAG: tetratricopeptide repeat protein [Pseudomonadota bacterium]|jgi:tetratricopeptide (TPR) repeat protein|nr:tetratricopeptide repeat protein [Pseudomonadota bacterium]|tara:strand:- start:1312 stop:1866 length:555 start_codon:yes stop_codon:yes gene_type:complete